MKRIVMLGRQGSGKGTQAELLADRLSLPTVSTGDLFRSELNAKTDLGQEIYSYMKSGDLVPDELVMKVLNRRLEEEDVSGGFILDGFPRNLHQAKLLTERLVGIGQKLDDVVYIDISEEVAIRRLSGRRVCSDSSCGINYHVEFNPPEKNSERCDRCGSSLVQREDDRPESIRHRLALYDSETSPLVDYYRDLGLLRKIDGDQAIDDVEHAIEAAIELK